MFSTDKNIDTLARLIETVKDYVGLQKDLLQLNVVTKTARVLTLLLLTIILSFFLLLLVIFLSFAAAFALSSFMPTALAFLTIAGAYFLLFVLFYAKRSQWIERPLIRFFADILTE